MKAISLKTERDSDVLKMVLEEDRKTATLIPLFPLQVVQFCLVHKQLCISTFFFLLLQLKNLVQFESENVISS
jgi:hypothetical protein